MLSHALLLKQCKKQLLDLLASPQRQQRHLYWIEQFLSFNRDSAPTTLTQRQLLEFLNFLSTRGFISTTAQLQAVDALLFFYRAGLKQSIRDLQFQWTSPQNWQAPALKAAC